MGLFSMIFTGAALMVTLFVVLSMLRQPALRRMGLRNVSRRKWNTLLIVLGSMVGTALVSGSLVLNDSTGRFQQDEARRTLGEIDEVVQQAGQRLPGDRRPVPLFDSSVAAEITPDAVREASGENSTDQDASSGLLGNGKEPADIDGTLGVLTDELPAASLDESGETVAATPAITVVGTDWDQLGRFGEEPPEVAGRPEPGSRELYASEGLAERLELSEGSKVRVTGRKGPEEFTVAAVVPEEGIMGYRSRFSRSDGTALFSQKDARELLGAGEGQINAVFVSNKGDLTSGVGRTDNVSSALDRILGEGSGFQVLQAKKDTLENGGFQISQIFLMISSFAILAGVLLIVNIYTMLAEERKGELGILRAIALKRGGLVRLFVYEGYAYSLLASILGVFVGLGVAAGLVWGINRATATFADLFNNDPTIPFHIEPASLLVAAASGLLVTFFAVFLTSLRIGNLNVVAAIRDLPESRSPRHPRLRFLLQGLLLLLGVGLMTAGFQTENGYLILLGPVLAAFMLGFLLSRVLPARLIWTAVGAGVLAYAYFASGLGAVSRANEESPAIFFVEGVLMVLGAILLVTFNLSVVYGVLRYFMRLTPGAAPVLKLAVAHPASRPARTGFTLAMFALVLYMVTISSIFASTQAAASQQTRDEQLSGYDGVLQSGPLGSISGFKEKVNGNSTLRQEISGSDRLVAGVAELPDYKAEDYSTRSGPPIGQAIPGAGVPEYVTYVPDGFSGSTTDSLEARSPEYATDREAWEALQSDPSLAILTFPYNGKGNFLSRPRLGPGDTLTLRDPISGREVEKKIIGRIRDTGGFNFGVVNGVIAGEGAMGELPNLQMQETYLLKLRKGADTVAVGRELKKEFAETGAQSFLLDDILGRAQRFLDTFVGIVRAFLAFGLVVGLAGLAVISVRAVHERRREIGALRALGFKKGMIGRQFVIESSFIALLGIILGIAVGTLGGYNLFSATVKSPDAQFVFPWLQMIAIGLLVWAASFLFTIVPAVRASRIPPVEALRHEG